MRDVRFSLVVVAVLAAACSDKTAATAGTGDKAGSATPAATAAPGAQTPPAAPAKPATPAAPIREALIAEAGAASVLLALDAQGQVIARTADGSFSRVLVPGPYGDGMLDAERDLLWLRGDRSVDVLDLRGTALTAAVLITFPDKAMEALGQHLSEPPTWMMNTAVNMMLNTPCKDGAGLRFVWALNGETGADWAKGFRAVNKDWFAAEVERTKRTLPTEAPAKQTKRKVPRDVGTCAEDARASYGKRRCGVGTPLGALGAELVVVGASPERCPAVQCQLYDPKAKKLVPVPAFAEDDEAAPTCGPYLLDAPGTAFAAGDKVCGADLTCSSVGRLAIGWLDSNRTLQVR